MSRGAHVLLTISTPDVAAAATVGAELRLSPSQVRPTTMHAGTHVVETHDWQLASPLPESEPVEAHLDALLAQLRPRAGAMRAIAARHAAGIHCQLDFKPLADSPFDLPGYPPGFALSRDCLQALADLG